MGAWRGGGEMRIRRPGMGCLMVIALGIVLLAASSTLFTAAVRIRARANPHDPFPFWSNPPVRPPRANRLQGLAGATLILGGFILFPALGFFTALLIAAVTVVPALAMLGHNRAAVA